MSDIARPVNPAPLEEGMIYEACRDFVLTYGLPALPPENVIHGWQNMTSLPAGMNNGAIISVLHDRQHGTTVEEFEAENSGASGILSVKGLIEVAVQIDFCAEDDTARQRARRLAIVARSGVGVQFFKDYGLSALYADDARDISFVGDAKQFIRRWMTTLHLTAMEGIVAEIPHFNKVTLSRLEDVGAHHKP